MRQAAGARRIGTTMRFTRLHLQNWKNFSDVVVDVAERAFVVGPNAAGKSNFIDAFRFLRDIASPEGGLQRAVADRGGLDEIRFLGAPPESEIGIDVLIGDGPDSWRYVLQCKASGDGGVVLSKEWVVLVDDIVVLDRPDSHDDLDPLRLRQTAIEQVSINFRFRFIVDFFNSIAYLPLAPELIRDRDRTRPLRGDTAGSDLLDRVMQTPRGTLSDRMRRINAILRVALPQLDRVDIESAEGGAPHLWMRFKNWRPTASAQNERQLSDGTLRLFGLLWALMEGDGPLLLEEPELSLHPGVIRHLVSLVRTESPRQTIISTHSLDLLSDEGIAPEEVLLLEPTAEGTRVSAASSDDQLRALLEGGVPLGDAVLPGTAPPRVAEMLRASSES
jgi:hypothetical protein